MLEFNIREMFNHRFHVNNDKGESVIGYNMIISHDLMVQLGLKADFKRQVLQWDGNTVHMKEPSSLLGKSDLNKREMREVLMQNTKPASTREDTERKVNIFNVTYAKVEVK